jgi:hypothetical protein
MGSYEEDARKRLAAARIGAWRANLFAEFLLAGISLQPLELLAQLDVTVPGVLGQAVAFAGKARKLCGMPN